MRRFGKMVSCKLVIDKVTGKHKGTGFCQFVSASSAQAACEAGGAFTGTDSWEEVQRKKDKRLQGSAVRGVLDDFNETLSMNGRHLFVALAVDRTKVDTLEAKEKLDPRNLHLSKEGVILEDSPEAKNMPPQVTCRPRSHPAPRCALSAAPHSLTHAHVILGSHSN